MSNKDDTEEKSLPATPRKLRELRKKGQVARSRDVVSGLSVAAVLLYLWGDWPQIRQSLSELLTFPTDLYQRPFMEATNLVMRAAIAHAVQVLAPLVLIVLGVTFLAGMISTGGLVVAFEPITPKADHINPASGFKKLFSTKNLVEFVKSIVKMILLMVAVGVTIRLGLGALLESPYCGLPCVETAIGGLLKPAMVMVIVVFLLAGLVDVGIQRLLFLREMRMSKTEFKRERKEQEGDPHIKQERRRYAREMAQSRLRLGPKYATIIITAGEDIAVGLRFVNGETPIPMVVCKGRNERARAILAVARRQAIPAHDNADLAGKLQSRIGNGRYISEDLFPPVVLALTVTRAVQRGRPG
jgi:type III secretion protein U